MIQAVGRQPDSGSGHGLSRPIALRSDPAPALVLAATGTLGFAAQVVLLRELMASFSGNELFAGTAVAVWILSEAVGAWLAGRILARQAWDTTQDPRGGVQRPASVDGNRAEVPWVSGLSRAGLPVLAWSSVVSSLAAVMAAVLVRPLFGIMPGESVGIPTLVGVVAGVAFLPAATHGALFVFGAALTEAAHRKSHTTRPDPQTSGVGRAYLWEGLGTAVSGLAAFGLMGRLPAVAVVAVAAVPLVLLVGQGTRTGYAGRNRGMSPSLAAPGHRTRTAAGRFLSWLLACVLLLSPWWARPAERWVWSKSWPGQRVTSVVDSRYGKLVRLERDDTRMVLRDGVTVAGFPATDVEFAEELVHVPLLCHPQPERVLFLGQGSGIFAGEILKHPVREVVLVEADAVLTREVVAAARPEVRAQFADLRVRHISDDPLHFLLSTRDSFDCIILPDPLPHSLAGTRLYTLEFYRLCESRLTSAGILALPGPGAGPRPAADAGRILATRLNTLRRAFPEVWPVCLDFPLFVCFRTSSGVSGLPPSASLSSETLSARMISRGIGASLLGPEYLSSLLAAFRQDLFRSELEQACRTAPHSIATAAQPRELFLSMVRATRSSSPGFARFYLTLGSWISGSGWRLWLILAGLVVCILIAAVSTRGRAGPATSILTSGFGGSAVSCLVLFAWQVRFGSVYSAVSMVITSFMAGTVLGAFASTKAAGSRRSITILAAADLLLAGCLGAVVLLLHSGPAPLFLAVNCLAGACLGLQFPIAGAGERSDTRDSGDAPATRPDFRIPEFGLRASALGARPSCPPPARPGDTARRAGTLLALDLLGGFAGGLAVALVLVPIAGVAVTAVLAATVKLASAAAHIPTARRPS